MNRLAAEQSPYLLQHASNPVNWYPWGEEAFELARREGRPIFLSVGYSTCHWCHVMEHESFENPEIADILNRAFVSIKVDREERPDVDRVYMAFVQATTGSGGWPMSVWLTPDLKPFYGGTYFPPAAQWGRPGFGQILTEVARVWQDERDKVVTSAETIMARLRSAAGSAPGGELAPISVLAESVAQFGQMFDTRRGGFGDAPKFPRPAELYFLLREHARAGDDRALQMALETLHAMAVGGMRDHVGGGFHRYSVDAEWRVPHFEKMLYDQAQLVIAYLEAAQAAGDPFFAQVAEDTLQYVGREMTDRKGGFYSAEDADSLPPDRVNVPDARKMEGAFYLWSAEEIAELAGSDADLVMRRFGIDPDGNAPQDPHGEFTGKNLLYLARSVEELSKETGRDVDEVVGTLSRARLAMYQARARRPRPHLDDKILTAWNGLMIAAFARGARVLSGYGTAPADAARADAGAAHLATAREAARFIRQTMWDASTGTLLRRFRGGDAAIAGYAEDYAFLVWGLLELFQSDPDPEWLEWAIVLQHRQDALFWDDETGGWFSTTGDDPSVLVRMKEDYDGAEPSATSTAVCNLLTLAHLSPDPRGADQGFAGRIERVLESASGKLPKFARGLPMMLAGLSTYYAGVRQVAVVGPDDREDTQQLLDALNAVYLPFGIAVRVSPGPQQERLARVLPWVGPLVMRDGRATAYVCREFVCDEPVTSPDALLDKLRSGS